MKVKNVSEPGTYGEITLVDISYETEMELESLQRFFGETDGIEGYVGNFLGYSALGEKEACTIQLKFCATYHDQADVGFDPEKYLSAQSLSQDNYVVLDNWLSASKKYLLKSHVKSHESKAISAAKAQSSKFFANNSENRPASTGVNTRFGVSL
jgi:hypothetical protein